MISARGGSAVSLSRIRSRSTRGQAVAVIAPGGPCPGGGDVVVVVMLRVVFVVVVLRGTAAGLGRGGRGAGGGGGGYPGWNSGNGGSGVVILKYQKVYIAIGKIEPVCN